MCNLSRIISLAVLVLFGVCCFYITLITLDQREATVLSVSSLKPTYRKNDDTIIGNDDNKIFWFLQITDLHVSKYKNHDNVPKLKRFLEQHVPIISPEIVLISGDLTDAKTPSGQGSEQNLEEWKSYKRVIDESEILSRVKLLDLRGNHDSFDVPNLLHQKNLYKTYSVQGRQHRQSYMYTHRKPYGTYSIIAMDACPNPGPKRPFNFFGVVSGSTIQLIQHYSHLATGSNLTIWFGHYPTSTIVSPGYDLRSIIGRTATAYLCGHLHTLGNTVRSMYSLQPQGYLELELGDWKDNKYFRVAAIDHDLLSFVDGNLDDWPVVLVTNPKNSAYLLPHKEPVQRIVQSTHIRILAFSIDGIDDVQVYIDGKYQGQATQVRPDRPLFTLAWKPQELIPSANSDTTNGDHVLEVLVKDKAGRSRKVKQPFSVTGTPTWKFNYGPSLILTGDLTHLARLIYYTNWIMLISPVVVMRFVRYKSDVRRLVVQYSDWLLMLYQFSQNDFLFYPWILYFLYSACGPLVVGSVISGGFNFVFVHGLYVNGVYIPESLPYVSECIQNLLLMTPVLIYFSRRLMRVSCQTVRQGIIPDHLITDIRKFWGVYVILTLQMLLTFLSTYLPYGLLATVLSPCRMGLFLLIWFMHRSTIPRYHEHRSTHTKFENQATGTQKSYRE